MADFATGFTKFLLATSRSGKSNVAQSARMAKRWADRKVPIAVDYRGGVRRDLSHRFAKNAKELGIR
jgi:hypothetical protein